MSSPWHSYNQRPIYSSEWVNLWVEDVELPNGECIEHHVLRMPRRSVAVVVLDDAKRVLLIWRHRFITDTWGWEVPAGWTEPNEDPRTAAHREVLEETGWCPSKLKELTSYYALTGISDCRFTIFCAEGAIRSGGAIDEAETAHVEWIPLVNIRKLIAERHITDGPTITALSFVLAFPIQEE